VPGPANRDLFQLSSSHIKLTLTIAQWRAAFQAQIVRTSSVLNVLTAQLFRIRNG
jgi:hypothetical protein